MNLEEVLIQLFGKLEESEIVQHYVLEVKQLFVSVSEFTI
jgi:hypothetical protein